MAGLQPVGGFMQHDDAGAGWGAAVPWAGQAPAAGPAGFQAAAFQPPAFQAQLYQAQQNHAQQNQAAWSPRPNPPMPRMPSPRMPAARPPSARLMSLPMQRSGAAGFEPQAYNLARARLHAVLAPPVSPDASYLLNAVQQGAGQFMQYRPEQRRNFAQQLTDLAQEVNEAADDNERDAEELPLTIGADIRMLVPQDRDALFTRIEQIQSPEARSWALGRFEQIMTHLTPAEQTRILGGIEQLPTAGLQAAALSRLLQASGALSRGSFDQAITLARRLPPADTLLAFSGLGSEMRRLPNVMQGFARALERQAQALSPDVFDRLGGHVHVFPPEARGHILSAGLQHVAANPASAETVLVNLSKDIESFDAPAQNRLVDALIDNNTASVVMTETICTLSDAADELPQPAQNRLAAWRMHEGPESPDSD